MKKEIMQFRYYSTKKDTDNTSLNQPRDLTIEKLAFNGGAFKDIAIITQLGIQTMPGIRFHLNNADSPDQAIIIGSTGIYELELEGISEISNLWFEVESLKKIDNNPNGYLIIDMVCEMRQEA